MCGKLIILMTFLAFTVVQLAQGKNTTLTKCYSCDSPTSCRTPTTVICNQKSANATHSILAKHFFNVFNITNTEFECMQTRYTLKNSTVLAISGCINAGFNPCRLHPKNDSYIKQICKNCNKNLCNPAGTFSLSSAIMMPSIFGLLLLKFLYF